jgi:ATP-dependent RNA helicase DeaD
VVDAIGSEDLGFFMSIVNDLVEENELDIHEVAAALTLLAQRERPLQIEQSGRGWDLATAEPGSGGRAPREEHFTTGAARERTPRPNRDEILARRRSFADGALVRYRIEVGRNQGASPKEIVGAIANEGGIEGKFIGQIHLFDDFSTVELPANLPNDLMDILKRTRVRQMQLNIRALSAAEAAATPERRRPPRDSAPGGERREGGWQKKSDFERRQDRTESGATRGKWERDRPSPAPAARRDGAPTGKPFPRSPGASYSAGKPRKRKED